MFGLFKSKTPTEGPLPLRPVRSRLIPNGAAAGDPPQAAAMAALDSVVEDGMIVGLGTGRAAAHFIRGLAASGKRVRGVPTSAASEALALELGVELLPLEAVDRIDVTVDGADEIAPDLSVIKGGGGALLREKLVWAVSDRCVVVADASKKVTQFGRFPLPIEVTPFLHHTTAARLQSVLENNEIEGGLHLRMIDGRPFVTDGGNLIYDLRWTAVSLDAAFFAACEMKEALGVVETGVFNEMADEAFVASDDGVEHMVVDHDDAGGGSTWLGD
jgi:ribose 5-phosphate isomerase A